MFVFLRKKDTCQRLGWLFVLVAGHLGRKEWPRGRGWPGKSLDLQPHLSDGFPTICWGYPEIPSVCACSSTGSPLGRSGLGLGWPLEAESLAMSSATEIARLHLRGGGFLRCLSPPNRKLWLGIVPFSCSYTPARAWAEVPRHAWRRGMGWGTWDGGYSEGKGK